MTSVNPNDQFVSGYSLGGDPHQVGIPGGPSDEQVTAVTAVAKRHATSPEDEALLLSMLLDTPWPVEVATPEAGGRGGEAA